MLFKKRRRKDPLIAIQSSLSPGGSAAVLHSEPGVLPGSSSLGWGAGTSTFVKAPSSVFMKIRNSALESLVLLPSLPACFWKTAIRDSMHRSVSVGLDTFAFGGGKKFRIQTRGGYQELGAGEHARGSRLFILDQSSFLKDGSLFRG